MQIVILATRIFVDHVWPLEHKQEECIQIVVTKYDLMDFSLPNIGGHCEVELQCQSSHCFNQVIKHHCVSANSLFLTWKIKNNISEIVGSITYSNSSVGLNYTVSEFEIKQISQQPIVSVISFTVMNSIDKYVLECEDSQGVIKTCVINISGNSICELQ